MIKITLQRFYQFLRPPVCSLVPSDAAIIDALMAAAMVGEGTSYSDLTYTASLNSEEYGVAFRQGSDLAEKLNAYFSEAWQNGTMQALGEKYGVSAALIPQV